MTDSPLTAIVRKLRRQLATQVDSRTDAVLLEQFVHQRDPDAFAALVRRHGPLVWRVCHRVVRHTQLAEDAYQATFLALVQQAAKIRKPAALASWLYGVAYRFAVKKRADLPSESCGDRDRIAASTPDPAEAAAWHELEQIIVEEVQSLADKYRLPILLCYWEGLTNAEAAVRLDWPEGTVKTRLLKARQLLHQRLTQRGVSLSVGAFVTLLAARSGEAVPPLVMASALRLPGTMTAALAEQAGARAAWHKIKMVVVLLFGSALATGIGAVVYRGMPSLLPPEEKTQAQEKERNAEPAKPAREQAKKHLDLLDDPLPQEAVARLGSRRLYHGAHVHRVTLSPDGKWVVSTGYDGNRLWDAATGREQPLRKELREAAVFATREKLVAVAKQNFDLQLWDMVESKKIGKILPAAQVGELPLYIHFGNGQCPVGLAPNGRTLVICNCSAQGQSVFRFCDMVRGHREEPVPLKADHRVQTQMVFSADSKTLVFQSVGKGHAQIHVWDVERRKEIIASPSNAQDYSGQIALSPDGKILATVPFTYKGVRLWDMRTLKELPSLLKQPEAYMVALAFSPDGKRLAVSHFHFGPLVRVWDVETRKEAAQWRGKDTQIFHMNYTADGKYLAAGDGAVVTFFDAATGKLRHDFGHTGTIAALAFSPDGKRLLSGTTSPDTVARLWGPLTGKEMVQLRGSEKGISIVSYSPDGKRIATAGEEKTIRLWDAATARGVRSMKTPDGYVSALAFSSDGKTIVAAAGRFRKFVHQWDAATGRELRSIPISNQIVLKMLLSPDGKILALCGSPETEIGLWDLATGEQLHRLAGPKANPPTLAFSPDGKTLAAGGIGNNVYLWDVSSGETRRPLLDPRDGGRVGPIESLMFSPDGRTLAVGYGFHSGHEEEGCMARIYELSSRRVRLRYERGTISHRQDIRSLAFSPDSTLLATGGMDRTILIWDTTGQRTTHLPRKDRLAAKEGNALWETLAEVKADKAYRAMQTLLAAREQAVTLLKDHLHPAAAFDERRIDRLIADLDSAQFAVREKATKELRLGGEAVEAALRKLLAGKPSPEQRLRATKLLDTRDTATDGEQLRSLRAAEVLEWIGSVEAQKILKTLSEGDAQARLTREAKAALDRLAQRRSNAAPLGKN